MKLKNPQNCWEFWHCEKKVKEQCPAYKTHSGKDCWCVADNFTKNSCPKSKNEFKGCWQCPWFKKMNPEFEAQFA